MTGKPSEKEEEFFARQEFERRKREAHKRQEALAQSDQQTLKELHWMRCPKCGRELAEVDFQGVKIDRCTGCDGIFLDAGELDGLLKQDQGQMSKLLRFFRS